MHSTSKIKHENMRTALASLRLGLVQVGVFSLFINLLMLMPPLYMLQVYDRVLTSRSSETLLLLTLLLGWMFLTLGVLELVRSRMMVRLGARLDDRLSARLYRVAMRLALRHPGRYGAQPLNDLSNLRQFISGNGTFALFDVPWVPVYLALLFLFHPLFGLLASFAAGVMAILAIVNEYSTRARQRTALEGHTEAARIAEAQMRNPEVLRAMGMEVALRDRWLASYRLAMRAANEAADRTGTWVTLSKTLRLAFQSLMLGLGAYLAIQNEITAGMVIAGSIILGRSLAPIDQLIGAWKGFVAARLANRRLNTLLDEMPEEPRRLALPVPRGELTVEKALLIPPGADIPALRGIHFGLRAGEALAIIGPSAAGKSCLARAMLGLWPLASGHIRLDGASIDQWNSDQLGPRIGYLPQDVELFEGTIAENIARFGKLDETRIAQAARIAGVDRMIRSLPRGYDTFIGPDGIALSGGQRQRIGLARAVYGRPRLIVLDEPNANLDRAGDMALATACAHLKAKGVTLVLISHRREILQHVDKILVIERGRQTLFGPRDAVLEHLDEQARPPAPRQPLPIPERGLRMAV